VAALAFAFAGGAQAVAALALSALRRGSSCFLAASLPFNIVITSSLPQSYRALSSQLIPRRLRPSSQDLRVTP